jgi:hypothetical protein
MAWAGAAIAGGGKMGAGFTDSIAQVSNSAQERRVEKANEEMYRNLESQAYQKGARDEDAARRDYRLLAGDQAAAIAEGGGGFEGSSVDVFVESERNAFLDALNIRYDAGEHAREYRYEAQAAHLRSELAKKMQKRAKTRFWIQASGLVGSTGKFPGLTGGTSTPPNPPVSGFGGRGAPRSGTSSSTYAQNSGAISRSSGNA